MEKKFSTTITIPSFIIENKPEIVVLEPSAPDVPTVELEQKEKINANATRDESGDTENPEMPDAVSYPDLTRFALKYLEQQPLELQTIIYSLIEGLNSSVTSHKSSKGGEDHLILRQSTEPDWEVYIISLPRKKLIEILFNAEADEVITGEDQGETHGDKLAEFQCLQLVNKHKSWGDYLNCQLNIDSSESKIESVRLAINWFLFKLYGPTIVAKKYIKLQPLDLQTIIYSLIEGLSSSVTYHYEYYQGEPLTLEQSKDDYCGEVYITSRPRKKVIEIMFNVDEDEEIRGEEEETYGDKIAEFQCTQLVIKKDYLRISDYLNCQLNLDSSESEIESVRLAINWFLESYKY